MNNFLKKTGDFFKSRGFNSGAILALVIAVIVIFNIVMYTLTTSFGLYLYVPNDIDTSITDAMSEVLTDAKERGEEITVTFCNSRENIEKHATGMYVLRTAEAYAEKYDLINIRFVNILTQQDEEGNLVDLSRYLTDLRGNENYLRSHSIIFSSGENEQENYKVVTDVATGAGYADFYTLDASGKPFAYVGEEVFGAMLAWVLTPKHRVVYMTEGHSETADIAFVTMLTCAGYYVEPINLRSAEAGELLLDADVAALIISNPTSDFERSKDPTIASAEIEKIEKYLDRGGNLYVSIDPYIGVLPELEGFLSECGITIEGGIGQYGNTHDIVIDAAGSISLDNLTFVTGFAEASAESLPGRIVGNFSGIANGRVLTSKSGRLTLSGTAEALLTTTAEATAVRDGGVVARGEFAVAAAATLEGEGGKSASVVVIPSVLLTNADLLSANGYSNKEFMYSLLEEALGSSIGIYGAKSVMFDAGIVENLTQRESVIYTVVLLLIPTAIAITGAVTIIRRKNR